MSGFLPDSGGGVPAAHALTHEGGSDPVDITAIGGDAAGIERPPTAHLQTISTISDAGAKGQEIVQSADAITARDAIKVRLDFEATADPIADNDEADTAGIGTEFSVGDVWQRTDVSPVRWYKADSVTPGAAVWTQFNPAIFALSAAGVPTPAVPGDNNKVLTSSAGTPAWVAPSTHTQGTDQTVDLGGANETSAAEIRIGVDLAGTAIQVAGIPLPVAPYAVEGGALVYSGGATYQGIQTTLTEGAKPAFVTEVYDQADPHANQSIVWGATGVTLSSASNGNGVGLSIAMPAQRRFYVRMRIDWSAAVNWSFTYIELRSGVKFLHAGSFYDGDYSQCAINENGDSTVPAGGSQNMWLALIYDPTAGHLVRFAINTATAANVDPGSPFEGVNWVISGTTKSVAQADICQAPWDLRLLLAPNAAGTATALIRAPASGLATFY